VQKVRAAIQHQLDDVLNCIDLRADVLTGIDNRRGLEEMLDMLLAAQNRYGQAFSLVVVVIDHYRQISKSCGDAAVKLLLKAVAKMIQRSVRASDFVAHFRDDAFAVILTHTDLERAPSLCRRLQHIAKESADLEMPLRISTSAVAPQPGEDTAHLLDRAQAAVATHSGQTTHSGQ
jgi:diguanylate cyclase (GGDEF)-like protein